RRHTISKRDWSSDVCSSDLRDAFNSMGSGFYHLDTPMETEEGEVTHLEMVASNEDYTELHVEEFINGLNNIEQQIVRMRLEGKTQPQIAKCLGISQAYVCRLLAKIRNKYKEESA